MMSSTRAALFAALLLGICHAVVEKRASYHRGAGYDKRSAAQRHLCMGCNMAGSKGDKGNVKGKGGGKDSKGKGGKETAGGKGGDDVSLDPFKAEALCRVYESFNNFAPFLTEHCDIFEPLEIFLCPNADGIDAICDHPEPKTNHAISVAYCNPFFSSLPDDRAADCAQFCTNYISVRRANCCDWDCEWREPNPDNGDSSMWKS